MAATVPDLRTVRLASLQDVSDAIATARAEGWFVVLASRVPSGVMLLLRR